MFPRRWTPVEPRACTPSDWNLVRSQALREVRDRQLGFRHYHDLIVNMSKAVLQDDCAVDGGGYAGPDAEDEEGGEEEEEEEDGGVGAVLRSRCCCGGGGCGGCGSDLSEDGNPHNCRRSASVDSSHPRRPSSNSNNVNGGGISSPRTFSPAKSSKWPNSNRTKHGFGGGRGGASRSPSSKRIGSAPRGDSGMRACASSPKNRAAGAMSLARSGDGGSGGGFGPSILTALRETAAAGVGMGTRAGAPARDRGRPRERQLRA